jgi:hypothetical protein
MLPKLAVVSLIVFTLERYLLSTAEIQPADLPSTRRDTLPLLCILL